MIVFAIIAYAFVCILVRMNWASLLGILTFVSKIKTVL